METIINLLDKNLKYIRHEIIDNIMYIEVESTRSEVECPHCGIKSSKVHSRYKRYFKDLPIQDSKVIIVLNNKKYFCKNPNCNCKTFAETFDFISYKSRKTKRLDEKIINIAINLSSVSASKTLENTTVSISKSTICNILKKRNFHK